MTVSFTNELPIFVRKLGMVVRFSEEEKVALQHFPMQITNLGAGQDVVREGDQPLRCCAILDGFACTYKSTSRGKRQIIAFHVAGSIPDLQSLHLDVMDCSIGTITPCRVGFIQHEALSELIRHNYRIGAALWRETLIDAAICREWVVNTGQRDAKSRMAHLFCELMCRLQAPELTDHYTCKLPITQSELADALGISPISVNRTLQELRSMKLIVLKDGVLQILDWEALKEVGDFDPSYLHLNNRKPV